MVDEPTTHDDTQPAGGMPTPQTQDVLRYSIALLSDLAWVYLGIKANPATGETTADFAQARLAIDAIEALVPVLEGKLEAHDMRDLRNMLSSLQLNYVQRYQAGS